MSILEPHKVDIVATRPESAIVRLVIADHLDWGDVEGHSQLLQDKINTYLEFVESGQLSGMTHPPIPPSPDVRITLAMQHEPPVAAREFLSRVEEFLKGVGIKFELDLRRNTVN